MTIKPLPDSFDNRDGFIWYNGQVIDWSEAKLHALSHGLHYGSSVFEGIRAYGGKIFKLKEHMERLHQSAQLCGFTVPYDVETLCNASQEIMKKNNLGDAYLRPLAWLGSERLTISSHDCTTQVVIACWEWPTYYREMTKGIRVKWSNWKRPSPETAPCAAKAGGLYIICTISKNVVEAEGFHDALMLDYRGYVAECTSANVFMVKDSKIYTPIADCFLNGITRLTAIELAKEKGIPLIECHIKPEELMEADELFVTGTASEITPIGEVDGAMYPVGPITTELMTAYQDLVLR